MFIRPALLLAGVVASLAPPAGYAAVAPQAAALGRPSETAPPGQTSARELRASLAALDRAGRAQSLEAAELASALADVLSAEDSDIDAAPLYRRTWLLYRALLGETAHETLASGAKLARNLGLLRRNSEGAEIEALNLAGLTTAMGPRAPETLDAAEALVSTR